VIAQQVSQLVEDDVLAMELSPSLRCFFERGTIRPPHPTRNKNASRPPSSSIASNGPRALAPTRDPTPRPQSLVSPSDHELVRPLQPQAAEGAVDPVQEEPHRHHIRLEVAGLVLLPGDVEHGQVLPC